MIDTTTPDYHIPLINTVFASSKQDWRIVFVHPLRIKQSLEALRRNKLLQRRGLG